jgi:zinc protease
MTMPPVEVLRLDNGFQAFLVERRTLPIVASVLWYRVGSRDERTGETGVSHFLEHMMFKGTDRFPKGHIDLLTSKMGGNNNAFTDTDGTAYYFSMASDRWETVLEIEASRMRGCLLDPLEFASEKNVVLEELAMGEDDPWRPLFQACESLAFQVHPYHHPVIGWKQDLERLSVAQMRGYYERNYGPNRAFAVLVGDFDAGRTKDRIAELFGGIPAAEPRGEVLLEPPQLGERRAELHTPHSVARLGFAFPTCRMGERDDYALDILSHDLGSGKNSRLYRRLVMKEELLTEVHVLNETRVDPGGLFLLLELRDGASPKHVERAVREEVAALCAEGVRKHDHRRIREQIRAAFLFQDETALDQAMKIGKFEAFAPEGHRALATVLDTYDSLTGKELRAAAARYLDFRRASIVWALPAGSGTLRGGTGTATGGSGLPPVGKPAPAPAPQAAPRPPQTASRRKSPRSRRRKAK